MLEIKSLEYNYNNNQSFQFPDIAIGGSDVLLILGKSGIGKTTLLHLLGGLMKPQKGNIYIDKTDITSLSSSQLDEFRGRHIGIIFQKNHFINSLNVIENLAFSQQIAGITPKYDQIKDILQQLNIGHLAYKKTNEISQGESQRLAIARALINEPKLILADEPTSALDDENAQIVITLLQNQAQMKGAALVIVTHDQRLKDHIANQINLG